MTLNLRTGAFHPQVFSRQIETLAIFKSDGQGLLILVQPQFGRPGARASHRLHTKDYKIRQVKGKMSGLFPGRPAAKCDKQTSGNFLRSVMLRRAAKSIPASLHQCEAPRPWHQFS